MKLQLEIDLDVIDGKHHLAALALEAVHNIVAAGQWGEDVRDKGAEDQLFKLELVMKAAEPHFIWARAEILDEPFDIEPRVHTMKHAFDLADVVSADDD